MKSILFAAILLSASTFAQTKAKQDSKPLDRPKLVVGIMVDQMRWDYLYRFYDRYSNKGFKRILQQGFSCENTMIPYAQTVTAAGHASVYTGSTPALNGIMGNEWYDKQKQKEVYCVEDDAVSIIGGSPKSEPMSPKNLWASTISDELRLATNFKSKVIGIALKDRGSILPAGHTANGAYWYDSYTGNWVTSTYYASNLPNWVTSFNQKKLVDSLYQKDWNTLYPIQTYTQSDVDDVPYEGINSNEKAPVFPHELKSNIGKNYGAIRATPYGNTYTLAFAKAAIEAEELGNDSITDLLAISFSSPDYIGHQYGPNSIEVEDNYLRLDAEIGAFLDYLDAKIGKDAYTLFLTADHAVAHVPAYLAKHKFCYATIASLNNSINDAVEKKFGIKKVIEASANYQLYLNTKSIEAAGADMEKVKQFIIQQLNQNPYVSIAFDNDEINEVNLPTEVKEKFLKGYNTKLAGDIQVVLKPGYFVGGKTGTTHGSWNPYDSHIPLLWYGWGIKQGKSYKEYYMTDIAATLAALLNVQMPNACIGKPIVEVLK